jgi:hypothetical protein
MAQRSPKNASKSTPKGAFAWWVWVVALAGVVGIGFCLTSFGFRPAAKLAFVWPSGERLTYEIRGNATTSTSVEALMPGQTSAPQWQSQSHSLDALLHLEVGEGSAQGSTVLLATLEPQPQVGTPWRARVHLGEDGTVEGVEFLNELSPNQKAQALSWVGLFQVKWPPSGAERWTSTEVDMNGTYQADYQLKKEKGSLVFIRKQNVRYLPPAEEGLSQSPFQTAEAKKRLATKGTAEGRFDVQLGRLLDWGGHRQSEIWMGGKEVGRSQTQFQMKFLEAKPLKKGVKGQWPGGESEELANPEELARSSGRNLEKLSGESVYEDIRRELLKKNLGSETADSLLEGLKTLGEARLSDLTTQASQLEALIVLRPEEALRLGRSLADLSPEGSAFKLIASVLGKVGHAQAQQALREAISQAQGVEMLTIELASVPYPEQASEDLLRTLANGETSHPTFSAATYGLGRMAHRLKSQAPERAQKVMSELGDLLQESEQMEEKVFYLNALANIGLPQQLPLLRPHLSHADGNVRKSAYAALRFIPGEESENLLVAAIQKDAEPEVRSQAAWALGFRPWSETQSDLTEERLRQEKSPLVLRALLENLARAAAEDPKAQKTLRWFASVCAEPDLLRYTNGLVASLPNNL